MNFQALPLSLALLLGAAGNVLAESCTANIENISSRLINNHFLTRWRIRHDSGKAKATVFFWYRIHYKTRGGETLADNHIFRQLIENEDGQYMKDDISVAPSEPVEIVSVDFDRISCSK